MSGNSSNDFAGKAALDALKDALDNKPEATVAPAGRGAVHGMSGDATQSSESSKQEKAGVMSNEKNKPDLVEIIRGDMKVPTAGSAEAELQRLADAERAKTGTDADKEAHHKSQKLPEKGSAEAATHRLAAAEAGRPRDKESKTATESDGAEGNISFLLTALLLPLLVVGGIYGYAAVTERPTNGSRNAVDSATEQRIESEIARERAEVAGKAASKPAKTVETVGASTERAPQQGATGSAVPATASADAASSGASPSGAAPGTASPANVSGTPTASATPTTNANANATTAAVQPAPSTSKGGETTVAAVSPSAAPTTSGEPAHAGGHWDYDGSNGPTAWASLDPAFAACSTGQFQSPIDIPLAKGTLGPSFEYEYETTSGDVVNNGHTVLIKPTGDNRLLVNGSAYELEQLHFHTPSEHRIGGHAFPMEIHLVHKNAAGQRAVVAVMVEDGGLNPVLERLPVPNEGAAPLALDRSPLELKQLLPESKAYFTFVGSLTTPPCTESVGWIVLSQPIKVPHGSISRFQQVLKTNNRPLQPLNGRIVYTQN